MSSEACLVKRKPVAKAITATPEELLKLIVGQVAAAASSDSDAGTNGNAQDSEEILFDVDLDGRRYLLLRMAKPNRSRVQLSPREQEIVRMVAQGHSNKIIADVLSISSWTVCTHLRRIFAKLGVGSRAAMIAQFFGGSSSSEQTGECSSFSTRLTAASRSAL